MDDEQEAKVKAVACKAAGKLADKAAEAAQTATGWKKWALLLGAVIAGAAAYFTAGCTQGIYKVQGTRYNLENSAPAVRVVERSK